MNKIKINNETLDKLDENYQPPKDLFSTEEEIEVRIPFTGYYSIKVKCKDEQIAMLEVLRANELIGITSIEGTEEVIGDMIIDETYCAVR